MNGLPFFFTYINGGGHRDGCFNRRSRPLEPIESSTGATGTYSIGGFLLKKDLHFFLDVGCYLSNHLTAAHFSHFGITSSDIV